MKNMRDVMVCSVNPIFCPTKRDQLHKKEDKNRQIEEETNKNNKRKLI